jgi:hypothetical protein
MMMVSYVFMEESAMVSSKPADSLQSRLPSITEPNSL